MNRTAVKFCGALIAVYAVFFAPISVFADHTFTIDNSGCGQSGGAGAGACLHWGSGTYSGYCIWRTDTKAFLQGEAAWGGTGYTSYDATGLYSTGDVPVYVGFVADHTGCSTHDSDWAQAGSNTELGGCFTAHTSPWPPGGWTSVSCGGGSGGGAGTTGGDDVGTLLMLFLWTMMLVVLLLALVVPVLIVGFRSVFKPFQ